MLTQPTSAKAPSDSLTFKIEPENGKVKRVFENITIHKQYAEY